MQLTICIHCFLVLWPEIGSESEDDAQYLHHLVKIPALLRNLAYLLLMVLKSEVFPGCQGVRVSPWPHSSALHRA